jgi:hypothetical protein
MIITENVQFFILETYRHKQVPEENSMLLIAANATPASAERTYV